MALLTLDAWGVIKQTSNVGFTAPDSLPATFEATAVGAAGGTSIISTTLGAYTSANSDVAGLFVRVLKAGLGASTEKGSPLIRQVTAYDDGTSVLTIEALPFQTSTGDTFALYASPLGSFTETSGGSDTNIVDTARTEADDYFVGSAEQGGQYVIRIQADNVAGTVNALALDFDSATDTLSTATLGANTAIGDVYQPIVWPESADGPLTLGNPRLDRGSIIGQTGQLRGVAGLREVAGQKTLMFHGPGIDRATEPSAWDIFLGSVFTPAAVADFTVSSGSTTSNVVLSAGTPAANNLYFTEAGDVFMATAFSTPNVTALPTLRTAPAAATTAYGMRKYVGADVANYALGHMQWHGKEVKDVLLGTLPKITFEAARGDFLKMALDFMGTDGYRVHLTDAGDPIARGFNPKVPTVTPQQVGCVRVNLDDTEFEARAVTVDMGIDLQMIVNLCAPNAADGPLVVDVKPTGTFDLFLNSDSELAYHKFIQGKPMKVLIQVNESVGIPGVFAFWAYEIECTGYEMGDDSGQKTVSLQWRVTVDTTETTLAQWMIGIA